MGEDDRLRHLTDADIGRLEEAFNTTDLEFLLAAVDAIVGQHLKKKRSKKKEAP